MQTNEGLLSYPLSPPELLRELMKVGVPESFDPFTWNNTVFFLPTSSKSKFTGTLHSNWKSTGEGFLEFGESPTDTTFYWSSGIKLITEYLDLNTTVKWKSNIETTISFLKEYNSYNGKICHIVTLEGTLAHQSGKEGIFQMQGITSYDFPEIYVHVTTDCKVELEFTCSIPYQREKRQTLPTKVDGDNNLTSEKAANYLTINGKQTKVTYSYFDKDRLIQTNAYPAFKSLARSVRNTANALSFGKPILPISSLEDSEPSWTARVFPVASKFNFFNGFNGSLDNPDAWLDEVIPSRSNQYKETEGSFNIFRRRLRVKTSVNPKVYYALVKSDNEAFRYSRVVLNGKVLWDGITGGFSPSSKENAFISLVSNTDYFDSKREFNGIRIDMVPTIINIKVYIIVTTGTKENLHTLGPWDPFNIIKVPVNTKNNYDIYAPVGCTVFDIYSKTGDKIETRLDNRLSIPVENKGEHKTYRSIPISVWSDLQGTILLRWGYYQKGTQRNELRFPKGTEITIGFKYMVSSLF